VTIADVQAGVLPTRRMMQGEYRIDGIIGTGLLMHFLPTLDYCAGRLVLRPRSASAAFERDAARAGENIVPMWLVGDHFVFARARLGRGHESQFLVDTGMAGGGLGATKAALDEAGITIDANAAQTGIGGGGATTVIPFRSGAQLGAMKVEDVRGLYSPSGGPFGVFPFQVSGILSHQFFRRSRLTFDFDAMRLVTQAC